MTQQDAITFTVPAVPIPQPRPRAGILAGHARVYHDKRHPVHAFRQMVRLHAMQAWSGRQPFEGPIGVSLVFLMPRPASLTWKRRPMPRTPHRGREDCDNLAKGFLDALPGVAFGNDNQVATLLIEKWYAAGDESPGVMATIWELETQQ